MKKSWTRLMGGATVLAVGALILAACGSSSPSKSKSSKSKSSSSSSTASTAASAPPAPAKMKGGTAYFAEQPSAPPTYIFPVMDIANASVFSISDLQYLLYRPLYFYGNGQTPTIDYTDSVGKPPVWSADGKTVTISLNHYVWSDGETVSAKDVEFWQHLITAEKTNWYAYSPGTYPDNVSSVTVVNPTTIQFHLTKAYDHNWFLYNELSQITPLPQAWDVTSAGAKPGSGGCTTSVAKCAAVYNYLFGQAKKGVSTYASSPIWSVVDGPWKLQSLSTSGEAVFLPNAKYTGPVKPSLSKFVELPFTSDTSEFNTLRSGHSIDFGYIPFQDLAQKPLVTSSGYTVKPYDDFGFNYAEANLNSSHVGPILKQTYIRQVLEELIDQKGDAKAFTAGFGYPTCGPVPTKPSNPFASSYEKSCPYGYNPGKAVSTLRAHGWHVVPNGVTTCARPGSGSSDCGSGIAKGAKLQFNFIYSTGISWMTNELTNYKSDASKAGIDLVLKGTTFTQASGTAVPCKASQSKCNWDLDMYGGWVYAPDYYPTGEELYTTGAGANSDNYSNPKMDMLIQKSTLAGNSSQTLSAYENYATDQLPVIFSLNVPFEIAAVNSKLHVGAQGYNVFLNLLPERWYFTK